MHFIKGGTRYVFLVGAHAIKVGRIQPFCVISKVISLAFSRRRRKKFATDYSMLFFTAVLRYIAVGIWTNQNEFAYFQSHSDPRVMPCRALLLGGLILIQKRGTPVTDQELEASSPFSSEMMRVEKADLGSSRQYARTETGVIKLIDYGSLITQKVLRTHTPSSRRRVFLFSFG